MLTKKILAASITSASRDMAQATNHRQSYLTNTLQPQIDDLESRLKTSVEAISKTQSGSVGRAASDLTYQGRVDDAECRQMMNKMVELDRQFRFVQQKNLGTGRQAIVERE